MNSIFKTMLSIIPTIISSSPPLSKAPLLRSSPTFLNHMILIHDSTRPHNYSVHAGWICRALDHSILQCLETIPAYIQSIYILTWLFLRLDLAPPLLLLRGRPPQAYVKLLLLPEWNQMHIPPETQLSH